MPTYDYVCRECDYKFEEFQSMTDELLSNCPKCDGSVRRLIGGGTGLIFKGSGFYITDYKNSRGSADSQAKSSSTPKAKTETKSEKKKESSKVSD